MTTRAKIIIGATAVSIVGLTAWAIVEMNDWENRCIDAGGHVVTEYVGQVDVPIYGDKGQITGWVHNPIYNYHCMNEHNKPITL